MFTLRTRTDLTASDLRRLLRHGYEILAIETDHNAERDQHTIVWLGTQASSSPTTSCPSRATILQ